MDDVDKEILNKLQREFPIDNEPFKVLSALVGVDEKDILGRIGRLKKAGVIRRIGAVFDSASVGFASTLCAARVPASLLESFVDVVNSYPGVTHNYIRNHDYNVWFTIIDSTKEGIEKALCDISKRTGIVDVISMPVKRRFKVDTRLPL